MKYWMFINKPKLWNLRKFLEGDNLKEKWSIGNLVHEIPNIGDLGFIFATKDNRTLKELSGEQTLISGVYALIKVISEVDEHNYVEIEVLKNLINNPISLKSLESKFSDIYYEICRKRQASCREIDSETYKILRDLSNQSENFEIAIETSKGIEIKYIKEVPQKKNAKIKTSIDKWPRNPEISKTALEKADYKCEVNNEHTTFISRLTERPYMEAHHLIPMNEQDKFENNLDVLGNIVCLCSNCHRLLHHGKEKYNNEIIKKLYYEREKSLEDYGIYISLEDLKKIY